MTSAKQPRGRAARSGDDYTHLAPLFHEMAGLPEGDTRRTQLRERLVTEHMPVAEHIARRFDNRGEQYEDLLQVAKLGLVNAVDRFDPERGSDFLSFAVPTIMGEVRRHFRDASWAVRVPRRLKELHLSVSAAGDELAQSLGRAATPSEIAAHLGMSTDDVHEGMEAGYAYHSVSTDEVITSGPDAISLGDTLGEDDTAFQHVEYQESLRPLLRTLPERDRTILRMRFFEYRTQTQIAELVGISQMHVSRVLSRTLTYLRNQLREEQ